MSVVDTGYIAWPRKRPLSRFVPEMWRPPALSVFDPALADRADPLRTITFYTALALAFVKFGMVAEIQSVLLGFNLYLLYIFGAPAALGVVVAGGIRRALAYHPARYFLAFNLWMFLCVPLSSWKYGSMMLAKDYLRDAIVLMFVIGGLVVSWRECRLLMRVIGLAAVLNILTGRYFANDDGGRLSLSFNGTIGNANDYAAHLLLTLPFLLLFFYSSRKAVIRVGALLGLGVGVLMILKTASRGGLIAIIACTLFVLIRGSARQRLALLCLTPVTLVAVLLFVPSGALQRIRSFSSSEDDASQEALESSDARRYVMRKGIEYTLEFPVFGVGPGQFAGYEGGHNQVMGGHGMWHETHNAWLQASSECGIPGAVFLLSGYISSFLLLNRTYRIARRRTDCEDIRNMAFCVMLGMVGFLVAISFLNFAYLFYGPAMAGVAISIWRAASYEFEHRSGVEQLPSFAPPRPIATRKSRTLEPAQA